MRRILRRLFRSRRVRVLAVLGVLGGITLHGFNLVVIDAAEGLVYRDPAAVPERYVAIVLGAMTHGDRPSDVLEDRLLTALALYRAGKVRRVLVSGDHGREDYDEVRAMRLWLLERGVPADDVFMDHAGFRTLDTMVRAAQVFDVKDAVVVTQEFHLARAVFLAKEAGIDAIGLVADRRVYVYAKNYAVRETFARAAAWLDVRLGRGPRYLGAKIPITGKAENTYDEGTTE